MKRIFLYIPLWAMMLSCGNNFLDVTPSDKLSDVTFWTSESDAVLALNSCYNGWETGTNIVFLDAASDNGYEQFNYNYQPIGNGQILPTSPTGLQAPWLDGYATRWFTYDRIRKYNNFLEKVSNIDMDEEKNLAIWQKSVFYVHMIILIK